MIKNFIIGMLIGWCLLLHLAILKSLDLIIGNTALIKGNLELIKDDYMDYTDEFTVFSPTKFIPIRVEGTDEVIWTKVVVE